MIESPLILMIFDIINVVVAGSLGVYCFYKYGLGPLRDEIRKNEQILSDLRDHAHDLDQQRQHVDQTIIKEWDYGQLLLKKLETWNSVVKQKQHDRLKEHQEYTAQAHERVAVQEKVLHQHAFDKEVAQAVSAELSQECKKYFKSSEASDTFVSGIVQQLKRETL